MIPAEDLRDVRPIELLAYCGAFGDTKPDDLRAFEGYLDEILAARGNNGNAILWAEVRELLSQEIIARELGTGFTVIGPRGKVFSVTDTNIEGGGKRC